MKKISFFDKVRFPLKPFPAIILSIIIIGLICGAVLLYDSHLTTQMNAPAFAIESDESNVATIKQAQDATEEKDMGIEEVVIESISTKQEQNNDETEEQEKSTNTSSSTKSTISTQSSFTNTFGTPTTKCAHSGCNNFIASSGDTNCCTLHSRKCAECGKYIDEDATYCMDCISKAVTGTNTSYSSSGSSSSFSNEYGTATTKCAHPGCNNPIASSGDTNCCTIHSNRCLECGKYIDGDAMYCMSCLSKALQPSNSKSSGTSSSTYESSGTSSSSYDFSGYSDSMSDAEFDAWLEDVLGF